MGKLYVAYGSNLNLAQMAVRCPSAKVWAKGVLNNWELVYRGRKGNAHATIKRKVGSSVPVLIWDIQPIDERWLDLYEGYPSYYYKRDVMVDVGGRRKKAMAYVMDELQPPGRPSETYIGAIRQGYMDNAMDLSVLWRSLEENAMECE